VVAIHSVGGKPFLPSGQTINRWRITMFNFLSRLFTRRRSGFALRRSGSSYQGMLSNPLIRMALGGLATYAVRRFAQRHRYA
jgi:hypothetical protein